MYFILFSTFKGIVFVKFSDRSSGNTPYTEMLKRSPLHRHITERRHANTEIPIARQTRCSGGHSV